MTMKSPWFARLTWLALELLGGAGLVEPGGVEHVPYLVGLAIRGLAAVGRVETLLESIPGRGKELWH